MQQINPRDRSDYQIGVVCALAVEKAAVRAMLDGDEHPKFEQLEGDDTQYTLGCIEGHNVVIACLPAGDTGTANACNVATHMQRSFPVKFGLMVGVAGGVWSEKDDVHLGDVVVSQPGGQFGGVVQWDFGKTEKDGKFRRTSSLNEPPRVLLNSLQTLKENHLMKGNKLPTILNLMFEKEPYMAKNFSSPGVQHDYLFDSIYDHESGPTSCDRCDLNRLAPAWAARETSDPEIHYGTIASANHLMRHGPTRDKVAKDLGVICFEMEAAGLMNTFPCLVIRGICDYADTHKNKRWQGYAAATAAAFTKEFLSVVPKQEVAKLKPIVSPTIMIPYSKNPHFVGRTEMMENLKARLRTTQNFHNRTALWGLGGIGKSQIAIQYAYWYHENHPTSSVFWVHSSNIDRFRQDFLQISRELKIPRADDPKANIFILVKNWLERKECGEWLMIIDNADDIGMFFLFEQQEINVPNNSQYQAIILALHEYIPNCSHGNILITTRDKKIGLKLTSNQGAIEVPKLSGIESSELVQKALGKNITESDDITSLSESLEYLPLALAQATAYIQEYSISVKRYMEMLTKSKDNMLRLLHKDFVALGRDNEVPNAVAATWTISFNHIKKYNPRAADMLALMTFFDRQNIPIQFLHMEDINESEDLFVEACGILKAFSLIIETHDGRLFEIHRLVQLVTFKWLLDHNKAHIWASQAVDIVSYLYPKANSESWSVCATYLPHAKSVLEYDKKLTLMTKSKLPLLSKVATYLWYQGQWKEAEELGVQLMEITKKVLGPEHPNTLTSMGNLALTYRDQGRWKEAEELWVQVMETGKKVLGPEHPDTLTSMGNLALTYRDQGRWKEAEELEVQVMETRKKVLGPEHPNTLTSMGNLALTYRDQGRWKEAEELEVQVMETGKKVLGPEHPGTLTSIGNLASTYRDQGRWKEAEELEVQLMETTKKVLGPEHPNTLTSMGNLASTYRNQGRWKEAEELWVQVMETGKKVLGPEHPDTLTSMGNLASTYWNQGRWKEAEELWVQVMETGKKVLGPEHPNTLTSMGNLALTYWYQGRWKEAEELELQVMETRKKVLGPEHPGTLTSIGNLASTYRDQGRWKEAEELGVQLMETTKKVLGPEHPGTLISMGNLALTYRNQGRWKEAEELWVQVMETGKKVLGPEHPDTLTSMGNLASIYWNQGRWKEAEELEVQLMEITKKVLGPEHPDTLTSMGNLASTYRDQGRWKEAEELEVQVMETRKKVLGPEHPDTLTSIGNLASTYRNQGRWKEAEELELQVMETRKKVLGPEHPDTLTSMGNMALTLKLQNRNDEAIGLMISCHELRTKVLGPAHHLTQAVLNTLVVWRSGRCVTRQPRREDTNYIPGAWVD